MMTRKGICTRIATIFAQWYYNLLREQGCPTRWEQGPSRWSEKPERMGIRMEAARRAIVLFEEERLFCDENGECFIDWMTLWFNLRNRPQYRAKDPETAIEMITRGLVKINREARLSNNSQ
jgi:hypothetical protein